VKSVKELKEVSVATESATNACESESESDKCSANGEKNKTSGVKIADIIHAPFELKCETFRQ